MIRICSISLFALLLLFHCSAPNRETADSEESPVEATSANPTKEDLMEQVMALHDAVMPEMGNIRSTEKSLRELAESTVDQATKTTYEQQAQMLDSAFNAMMVWMRQFDPDYSGTEEEVLGYLEDQKGKMAEVKTLMETALADGKKLVEEAN